MNKRQKECVKFATQCWYGRRVLELGTNGKGKTTDALKKYGFVVFHTTQDYHTEAGIIQLSRRSADVNAVLAFEVLEHIANPREVLQALWPTPILVSIPLRVWFTKPHWNKKDKFDQHYHEFLSREFKFLIDTTKYKISFYQEKFIVKNWGFRQILTRLFRSKRYAFALLEPK